MQSFYLDLCCVNRPLDNQRQPRVRLEGDVVLGLIQLAILGELAWTGSDVLDLENSRNPDAEKRLEAQALLNTASSKVTAEEPERQRGRELQALGFGAFDALHIACAEKARVHVLLTVDDRLLRRALREAGKLAVRVENPVKWYPEAIS